MYLLDSHAYYKTFSSKYVRMFMKGLEIIPDTKHNCMNCFHWNENCLFSIPSNYWWKILHTFMNPYLLPVHSLYKMWTAHYISINLNVFCMFSWQSCLKNPASCWDTVSLYLCLLRSSLSSVFMQNSHQMAHTRHPTN